MRHARTVLFLGGLLAPLIVQCGGDRGRTETTVRMWREDEPEMTPASRFEPSARAEPTPLPAAQRVAKPGAGSLTDPQIAGVLEAANEIEIQHGRIALQKAKHLRVRSFAMMMISDHGRVQKRQRALMTKSGMTTRGSDVLSDVSTQAQAMAQSLQTASAEEFDRVYMGARIAAHQQLLDLLDRVLIPETTDPELSSLLEATRPTIARHLQHARELMDLLTR